MFIYIHFSLYFFSFPALLLFLFFFALLFRSFLLSRLLFYIFFLSLFIHPLHFYLFGVVVIPSFIYLFTNLYIHLMSNLFTYFHRYVAHLYSPAVVCTFYFHLLYFCVPFPLVTYKSLPRDLYEMQRKFFVGVQTIFCGTIFFLRKKACNIWVVICLLVVNGLFDL